MTDTVVFYHKNCADGFGAACVAYEYYGDDAEYIPVQYGDPTPDVKDKEVIILDFSWKRPEMVEILDTAKSVIVLDHHKTAQAELSGLQDHPNAPHIEFDMNRSGAMMAWNYFFPKHTVPPLISYIQDRDLWRFEMIYSREISEALRSFPMDFETWMPMMSVEFDVMTLARDGEAILRYHRQRVEEMKAKAHQALIGAHLVPAVNAPGYMASDVAGELSEGHPFAAVYQITRDKAIFSLRSRPNGLDVSEVAKQFGGGGHKHAAGFALPLEMTIKSVGGESE